MAFKLEPLEPSEADIKKAVIESLWMDHRVVEVLRINCGKLAAPGRPFGIYDTVKSWVKGREPRTTGISDIHGQLCDGRRLVIEVKTKSGEFQDGQQEYIDHALAHGAVGGIVRSADEAIEIIREAFK
jgi:hypothetical protein